MSTTLEREIQDAIDTQLLPRSYGDAEAAIRAAIQPITVSGPLFSLTTRMYGARQRQGYELEKAEFRRLLPTLHRQYAGQFVAICDGQVWGSDVSRNALVSRFFEVYPEGRAVYIGFVGPRPVLRLPTSLVRRT